MLRFLSFFFVIFCCAAVCTDICAQADASTQSGRPSAAREDDMPEGFREGIAKQRIKAEEKEYEELIQNGEEAVKLSVEISKVYDSRKSLTAEDTKKIDRLEKVVKKIRQDLGAKDETDPDDEKPDSPLSLKSAIIEIKETTSGLLSELKKTTRHSISVVAIQTSNTLLKLVRFAKFNKD